MNNPKFREKVLIGLENAPSSFNVRGKVVGPNGANLQYITNETGAIVTIRGRGSGYIEPNTGQESIEPLHICIEHSKYEVLQAGRQLAFNLIDTVQQEWANLQQQLQQEQQQQQQQTPQQQPPPTQQPPSVVSSSSSNNIQQQTLVSSEGSPTVTSIAPQASVGLPTQYTQQPVGQMISVPPPTHVAMPPPTYHIPSQLSAPQVATSSSNGSLVAQTTDNSQTLVPVPTGTPNGGQEVPVSQASAQQQPINIPAQHQVFLSNQGATYNIQPQQLIPQQQQIITPTGQVITAQPQVLAQSYLLQYMQTNSGQMVVSYPNIMRPNGPTADPSRGQQLMLVQYGEGGSLKTSTVRAPVPQPQQPSVPQMVQIVNPQTGQIQHVLQHIQPQLQMPQAQLQPQVVGQGGGLLGQQVLMPIQTPFQFTSQPQQMIIAQPPPQLQQQILPSGQALQHVIPTSTLNQVSTPVSINVSQKQIVLNIAKQQQQGMKRRFDGDQTQPLPIMDAQIPNHLQNKKGFGTDGVQRQPQATQQEIVGQGGEKNQFGQDEWRRNSPLLSEGAEVRGDTSPLDPNKRARISQNGQGNEVVPDVRTESLTERYSVSKIDGLQQLSQAPQQIYSIAGVPQQQQQSLSVHRQTMHQIYQTAGALPQHTTSTQSQQTAQGAGQTQLPPGTYTQQMYPPPPIPSSTAQVNAQQQYVSPPIYNTIPQQQSYTTAQYNPWIMPS